MIPKRLPRALSTFSLTFALLSAMLAMPGASLAAAPGWRDDGVQAVPGTIKAGNDAGFKAEITNAGPSNISQLYADAMFSQGTTASYAAAYIKGSGTSDPFVLKPGACSLGAVVHCSFGALRSGQSARLIVAFPTGSDAGLAATMSVNWQTTGLGSTQCVDNGDQSHGDCLMQTKDAQFNTSANFDGGFVTSSNERFATGTQFGAGNWFATSFKAFKTGIPVTLEDDAAAPAFACPDGRTCYGASGQDTVLLNIDNGAPFGSLQPVTFQIYKDAVPKGSNGGKVTVVHFFDGGGSELIANDCPKNKVPTMPCRTVSWSGKAGVWTVIAYVGVNGGAKFF